MMCAVPGRPSGKLRSGENLTFLGLTLPESAGNPETSQSHLSFPRCHCPSTAFPAGPCSAFYLHTQRQTSWQFL